MAAVESKIPTINAFASIIVPADPAAIGSSYAVPDIAAGDLSRPIIADAEDPFGREMIRFYQFKEKLNPFAIFGQDEDTAFLFFNELDLQAQTLGAADFADLYASVPGAAIGIVFSFLTATVTPIQAGIPSSEAAYLLYFYAQKLVKIIVNINFPEHVVRSTTEGTGKGNAVYSDPANLIAEPNNRPPSTGGTATFVSFRDYQAVPIPLRQALADDFATALLEWESGAASEAAYAALDAGMLDGSIMAVGS